MDIFIVDMNRRDAGHLQTATENSVLYKSIRDGEIRSSNIAYVLFLRISTMIDSRGLVLKEGDVIAQMEVRRIPDSGFIVGRRLPKVDSYLELRYSLDHECFYFLDVKGEVFDGNPDLTKYERIGNGHVDNFI